MELFKKTGVKVLLLIELLAIGAFVTDYISLNQLLLVLGFIMVIFGMKVYQWSRSEKENDKNS